MSELRLSKNSAKRRCLELFALSWPGRPARPALERPFPPSGAHPRRQTRRPRSPRASRRSRTSWPGSWRFQCRKITSVDHFLADLRHDHRDGRGQNEADFRRRIRLGRAVLGAAQRDRAQRRRPARRGPVRVCRAARRVLDHLLGRRVELHRPAAAPSTVWPLGSPSALPPSCTTRTARRAAAAASRALPVDARASS